MAKEVKLGDMLLPCYYMPWEQCHPSVRGVLERIEQKGGSTVLKQCIAGGRDDQLGR